MHMMLENVNDDGKRTQLHHELTGRFRTMGPPVPKDEEFAPAWWHGDEEAFESAMSAVGYVPGGRQ